MLGDAAWFVAGRRYGSRVLGLLCRISLSPDSCVRQTEFRFERWGMLTLVLGKFIPGLSTVAPPLAGAMRVSWPAFVVFNLLGIALWAGAAIGAGMALHPGIEELLARLEGLGLTAAGLVAALLAGYIALKWWERRRFYKMLRVARISAEQLRSLFDGGKEPVVVDLRSPAARGVDRRFIPGALAMDLGELARRFSELPKDREVIFYCTCPNEASAASAARQLIDLGYRRVRPLEGGLDAWIAAGYRVEER
jgi:rhodanese-related sulfurtransferase